MSTSEHLGDGAAGPERTVPVRGSGVEFVPVCYQCVGVTGREPSGDEAKRVECAACGGTRLCSPTDPAIARQAIGVYLGRCKTAHDVATGGASR